MQVWLVHRLGVLLWAVLVVGSFLTMSTGCRRESQRTLRDTEQRAFLARCDREGRCELTHSSGPGADDHVVIRSQGRLVALCSEGSESASAAECRPLECEADKDCPPAHDLRDGTCVNGLCIEPSRGITSDDAVMLCLAGTGVGKSSPVQVERFALGLNCGVPCKVPATCRQP